MLNKNLEKEKTDILNIEDVHQETFFEKKIQTLLWCVLCMGSILSAVYFSLGYFKGEIYELLFNNSYVVLYTPMIPIVSLIMAVLTILASSHLNLKIALKISDSSGV